MKKTLVSLLLVAALLIGVLAPAGLAADALDKDAKIVLWLTGNAASAVFPEGTDENNNPFIDALREHTGYPNIEVVQITDGASQMNMLMGSGEYPDAIYVNGDRAFYLQYLTEGLWAPVDDAVAEYGPAITELMTPAVLAATQGEDGQHYAISMPLHSSYDGKYFTQDLMYRKDILEALGLDVPRTPEELKAVLLAVKEAYPDMIPLSLVGANSTVLMAAFGMYTQYLENDEGELVNTYREHFKEYVAYMHELYELGLLDEEMLYQSGAEKTEKVVSGRVFMIEDGVWCKSYRQSIVANGGEFTWDYLPEMQNIDGTSGVCNPFPTSNIWMFPVTSEHMNEVVDIINTFLTDTELETYINYGEEGVHYYYDDDGVIQAINDNGEYDSIMYKIVYRLWFKPDIWLNNAILGDFMTEIKLYTAAMTNTLYDLWGYMPTSEASIEYKSGCDAILAEYRDKIIVGDLPIDAVDEMFEKMDASGYTEIEAAAKEWYESTGRDLAISLGIIEG